MKLTIKNLKKVKYSNIAVFNSKNLVDIISKDLTCNSYPYTIGGSDCIFDEKEILDFFKDKKYYIYNANLINKPVETNNNQTKVA